MQKGKKSSSIQTYNLSYTSSQPNIKFLERSHRHITWPISDLTRLSQSLHKAYLPYGMISQALAKDEALKDNVPPCQGCPTVMVMEQWWNGDIARTNRRISEKDLLQSHIVYHETLTNSPETKPCVPRRYQVFQLPELRHCYNE